VPGSGSGTSLDAVSVRFEFYQYESDTTVDALPPGSSLSPYQFLLAGGNLKFNVRIQNWPFTSIQNKLTLTLGFEFPSQIDLTSVPTTYGTAYTFACTQGSIVLGILADSINDDLLEPVVANITTNNATAALLFTFDYFANYLFYDPSLGTLITPTSSGDGGSSNTPIFVGVFVSVGVVAILAFLALLVGLALLYWRRHRLVNRVRSATGNTTALQA